MRWSLADPEQIHKQAQKCFAQVQMIPVEMPVEGVEAFAACHYGKTDGFYTTIQTQHSTAVLTAKHLLHELNCLVIVAKSTAPGIDTIAEYR